MGKVTNRSISDARGAAAASAALELFPSCHDALPARQTVPPRMTRRVENVMGSPTPRVVWTSAARSVGFRTRRRLPIAARFSSGLEPTAATEKGPGKESQHDPEKPRDHEGATPGLPPHSGGRPVLASAAGLPDGPGDPEVPYQRHGVKEKKMRVAVIGGQIARKLPIN